MGRPPRVGTKTSCLDPVLISPPGRPLPRVPNREWRAQVKPALRPADRLDWTAGNSAGKRASRHILGPGSHSSPPGSLRGAENCGAAPVQATPLQKEEPGSLLHTQRSLLRETKASEARLDLGLAGQGLNRRLPTGTANRE